MYPGGGGAHTQSSIPKYMNIFEYCCPNRVTDAAI